MRVLRMVWWRAGPRAQILVGALPFLLLGASPTWATPPPFAEVATWPTTLRRPPLWHPLAKTIWGTPAPTTGTIRILTILVDYPDRPRSTDLTDDPAYFADMLFGDDATGEGRYPFPSLARYYSEQSYGRLTLVGDVLPWFTASQPATYYSRKSGNSLDGSYGLGSSFTIDGALQGGARALVAEALQYAVDQGVDLARYDANGDGVLDAVFVIHAGRGAEQTGDRDDLWSHQFEDDFDLTNGTWTVRYFVGAERFYWPPNDRETPSGIGVLAHEFGHILGLPDLYAGPGQGYGVGHFSLMGYGLYRLDSWNEASWGPDVQPMGLDPWSLARLEWVAVTEVTGNRCSFEIPALDVSGAVVKLPLDDADASEAYYLGYVRDVGFREGLAGSGLLLLHYDAALESYINGSSCVPEQRDCTTSHYWLSVEQADGLYDLESGINYGEARDLWSFGLEFRPDGVPTSCSWDGDDCRTRLSIREQLGTEAILRIVRDPDALPPPPVIDSVPAVEARVGEPYVYDPVLYQGTTDPTIRWTLGTGPQGMEVDPATGRIIWTPTSPGNYDVRLFVENCSGSDSQSWRLFVAPAVEEPNGCGCSLAQRPVEHLGDLLWWSLLGWGLRRRRRRSPR